VIEWAGDRRLGRRERWLALGLASLCSSWFAYGLWPPARPDPEASRAARHHGGVGSPVPRSLLGQQMRARFERELEALAARFQRKIETLTARSIRDLRPARAP